MRFDPYNRLLKIQELELQLSKWELNLECEGSILHILLHSWEHEMWLLNFALDLHFYKPLFWSQTQG
jgi:hypothetical protein